jgi:hypothetical protein
MDGDRETVDATRWRKKDGYLWISLGDGDLMLLPLAGVKKVVIGSERPKRAWSFDGTSEADLKADCNSSTWNLSYGTGDWYPGDTMIILGL